MTRQRFLFRHRSAFEPDRFQVDPGTTTICGRGVLRKARWRRASRQWKEKRQWKCIHDNPFTISMA